jgi:hypothetical protein
MLVYRLISVRVQLQILQALSLSSYEQSLSQPFTLHIPGSPQPVPGEEGGRKLAFSPRYRYN